MKHRAWVLSHSHHVDMVCNPAPLHRTEITDDDDAVTRTGESDVKTAVIPQETNLSIPVCSAVWGSVAHTHTHKTTAGRDDCLAETSWFAVVSRTRDSTKNDPGGRACQAEVEMRCSRHVWRAFGRRALWSKLTAQGRADLPPLRWKRWENEKFGAERQVYTVLRQARLFVVRNRGERAAAVLKLCAHQP